MKRLNYFENFYCHFFVDRVGCDEVDGYVHMIAHVEPLKFICTRSRLINWHEVAQNNKSLLIYFHIARHSPVNNSLL